MTTPEQLHTLVAEKVMGWEQYCCSNVFYWISEDLVGCHPAYDQRVPCALWNPLESWADAHRVLDAVRGCRFSQRQLFLKALQLGVSERLGTMEEFGSFLAWPDLYFRVKPADISLAALRALGVEVEA